MKVDSHSFKLLTTLHIVFQSFAVDCRKFLEIWGSREPAVVSWFRPLQRWTAGKWWKRGSHSLLEFNIKELWELMITDQLATWICGKTFCHFKFLLFSWSFAFPLAVIDQNVGGGAMDRLVSYIEGYGPSTYPRFKFSFNWVLHHQGHREVKDFLLCINGYNFVKLLKYLQI